MGASKTIRKAPSRRKALEAWQEEDAARLRYLWDRRPRSENDKQISQQAFGERYELGGQAGTWQYLSGRIPLNIRAVVCFARELGCSVEQISPQLAAQLALQRPETSAASTVIEGIERLSDPQRKQIFDFLVFQFEQAAKSKDGVDSDNARFAEAARKWHALMQIRIETNRRLSKGQGGDPPLSRPQRRQKVEQ